jgi:hypothetical protein
MQALSALGGSATDAHASAGDVANKAEAAGFGRVVIFFFSVPKCRSSQLSAIPRAFDDKDHAILQQEKLVPAFCHFLKTTLVLSLTS